MGIEMIPYRAVDGPGTATDSRIFEVRREHRAVPNAIWNSEKKCSEDAVFIFYTKGAK